MDGGYLSDQRQTREALIELARTMGFLLLSLSELDGAVQEMQMALLKDSDLSLDTRAAIGKVSDQTKASRKARQHVFDNLVKILTGLGEADG